MCPFYKRCPLFTVCVNRSQSHAFCMQAVGEFVLTDPNMTIPKRGKIFSINEGYAQYWNDATTKYIDQCKRPKVYTPTMLIISPLSV